VEVTLESIGRSAGVKKGIASMYYGSKEELFLTLLRAEFDEWYAAVREGLSSKDGRLSDQRLAQLLATSLAERAELLRFLSQASMVLEQNTEIMAAYRFHRWQRDRMVDLGGEIERSFAGMAEGDGLRLLHRIQLLAAGIQPYFDPRGSLAVNLIDPDFADLRLDMAAEIKREVLLSLSGETAQRE